MPVSPRESARLDPMPKHLHLTHPRLDFYVDVTVHEHDGRYMVTADLDDLIAHSATGGGDG